MAIPYHTHNFTIQTADAEETAAGTRDDLPVTPKAMKPITDKAGSALQPTSGIVRLPTFDYAGGAGGLSDVLRVFIEDRRANFARVDSEPAHDVKFQNGGWWSLDELTVTPFMAGAVGDGVTDDTNAVKAIVGFAYLLGATVYWPDAAFLTTESIPNFHDVQNTGPGRVLRGSDVWYITPANDNQRNIIHVGSPNLNNNDGLSSTESTNISRAILRMRNIGAKAANGRWRIQGHGSISSGGVIVGAFPAFRNRLEIWGDDVAMNDEPTFVWDGTSSVNLYAFRLDWTLGTAVAFLHFKNVKFTNWNGSTLAGGIVVWSAGDVLAENIWVDNCAIGTWFRQCLVRQRYGLVKNCQTYGTQVSYGATGYVGDLLGAGVTYENCNVAVSIGRETTGYIQGNTFNNNDTIVEVTRNSRIRTQGNVYGPWTRCVVYADNVGVWTNDNGGGYPDTYNMTPTDDAPVFRCHSGSVHQQIHRLDGNLHADNPGGSVATITSTAFTLVSDPDLTLCSPGDFVPARVPSWWAYSTRATLRVRILITLAANAGGTLYLHGNSPNATAKLGELTIPANALSRQGWIEIEFFRRKGSASGRYSSRFVPTNTSISPSYGNGATANLGTSSIRAAADAVINYRLYWQSVTTDQVILSDMKTYIET